MKVWVRTLFLIWFTCCLLNYPAEAYRDRRQASAGYGSGSGSGSGATDFDVDAEPEADAATTEPPEPEIPDLQAVFAIPTLDEVRGLLNGSGNGTLDEGETGPGRTDFSVDEFPSYEATGSRQDVSVLSEVRPPDIDGSLDAKGGPGSGLDYYDYGDSRPAGKSALDLDQGPVSREFIYSWDQMGLLMFILLCLILLTTLIFCSCILRHMYDWAIFRVLPTGIKVKDQATSSSSTLERKGSTIVKYTVGEGGGEEAAMVQLLSVSNLDNKSGGIHEYSIGPVTQKQEVHRTTAQVEILSEAPPKYPTVAVTVPVPVRPDSGSELKKEWLSDIFKSMENESEPEQAEPNSFNQLERLSERKRQANSTIEPSRPIPTIIVGTHSQSLEDMLRPKPPANEAQTQGLTFLEKYGVTSSRSTTLTKKTVVQTTETLVAGTQNGQGSISRSKETLGDDESMDEYLEDYRYASYPV